MFKKKLSFIEELNQGLNKAQKDASDALSMFKSTLTKLEKANEVIDGHTSKIIEEVNTLKNTEAEFNKSKAANQKVIDKLKSFLED